jgi:hypothetical protein
VQLSGNSLVWRLRAGTRVHSTADLSPIFNVPETNNFDIPAISLTVTDTDA